MSSSTAKNLRRITESVEQHDSNCESKAKAVLLCPYEFDRLGFDHITTKSGRRVPISSDDSLGTGRLRVVCDGYHGPKKDEKKEYEEPVVRTVEERELVPAGAPDPREMTMVEMKGMVGGRRYGKCRQMEIYRRMIGEMHPEAEIIDQGNVILFQYPEER